MDTKLLGQFDKEIKIEYRGEIYRVRDNGSACRNADRVYRNVRLMKFGLLERLVLVPGLHAH